MWNLDYILIHSLLKFILTQDIAREADAKKALTDRGTIGQWGTVASLRWAPCQEDKVSY